jgi:hypothetical protein
MKGRILNRPIHVVRVELKLPISQNVKGQSLSPAIVCKYDTSANSKMLIAIPESNKVVIGTLEPTLEMK